MFHTKIRRGEAFAAEQNTGEFKKKLLRSKRFEKSAENMNKTISVKYGIAPENIEEKSLDPQD